MEPTTVTPQSAGAHGGRWIAVAAALVAVATLAAGLAFLFLRDGGAAPDGQGLTAAQTAAPSEPEPDDTTYSHPEPEARDITGYARARLCLSPDGSNTYYASNLVDGRTLTCRAEGVKGFGIGESVQFVFAEPVVLTRMRVVPGYLKDLDGWNRWVSNGSLRRVTLSFSDGGSVQWNFSTKQGWQSRSLGERRTRKIWMTIDDVYYPDPGNRHYAEDTSVSEVEFYGWPASEEAQ